MTKQDFLVFALDSLPQADFSTALHPFAVCLLYQMKLVTNPPWKNLASHFSINQTTAMRIFYEMVVNKYRHDNNIPCLVGQDGRVNEAERDRLLQEAYDTTPTYYRHLVRNLGDPAGRSRSPVILNVDATYFDHSGSSDTGNI